VRGGELGQLDIHTGKLEGYRSAIALFPRRRVGVMVFLCDTHGDEIIETVTNVVIEAFARLRSEPAPTVGPDLQAATDRLLAWLAHPNNETAASVFSKEYLDRDLDVAKLAATATSSRGGDCRFDRFIEGWKSRGVVKMACKNADWTFHVQLEPAPPHLIRGWGW
jgi:hypothetical protein